MVERNVEPIKDVPLPHSEHGSRINLQGVRDQTIVQSLSVPIRLEEDAGMREPAGGCSANRDELAQLVPFLVIQVHEVVHASR